MTRQIFYYIVYLDLDWGVKRKSRMFYLLVALNPFDTAVWLMQIVYFIEDSQHKRKESFHAPGCVGHILDN